MGGGTQYSTGLHVVLVLLQYRVYLRAAGTRACVLASVGSLLLVGVLLHALPP